jgi:hypothetical protein
VKREEAALTGLAADVAQSSRQPRSSRIPPWVRNHPRVIIVASYLIVAYIVTAHLWTDPASLHQLGDAEDVDQATWFMRYTATAISHFRLPALITTAMNAPHGVNLMWNTSLLLPGSVFTPFTLLFGPQVSLTLLLVAGFAGSALSLFYVLRHWGVSLVAAALAGGLYGFSPALVNSGVGHYSLVVAIIPPLLVDRVLRMATGQGRPVRNGLWLGVLAAAQVFISEEALIDAVIATVIFLVVLAVSRPQDILSRVRPLAVGLGIAVIVALALSARALWVQFHGIALHGAAPPVVIHYPPGSLQLTNLGTLPYSWVTPADTVLVHTSSTQYIANHYPQPWPEYLGYLGVPLLIVLLAAIVYFWRHVAVRAAGLTFLALEWLSMGAKPLTPHPGTLPGFLLPWNYLQHLPILSGLVPDRLCIIADAMAAAVLAFSLDYARSGERHFARLEYPRQVATGIVLVALLFVFPAPYRFVSVSQPPSGWSSTFAALRVTPGERVLLAPFPWAGESQVMRWQAVTRQPGTMIGGDFIAPDKHGIAGRAGRAGLNATGKYIDSFYSGQPRAPKPSAAQISADLAAMKPQFVVADTSPGSPLGKFLISLFGLPTVGRGGVIGWRLDPSQTYPVSG